MSNYADDLWHSWKNHNLNENENNVKISEDDLKYYLDILSKYDRLKIEPDIYKNRKCIKAIFETDTDSNYKYRIVEAIIDTKNKEIVMNNFYKPKVSKNGRLQHLSNNQSTALTLPPTSETQGGPPSTNIITNNDTFVNRSKVVRGSTGVQHSFTLDIATDSDGRRLTPQQQKYFKDSKVRDEDGNLRVVYHGTDQDFTVFDRTKGRANMDIQFDEGRNSEGCQTDLHCRHSASLSQHLSATT